MQHNVYFWLKEEFQNEAEKAVFEKGLQLCVDCKDVASGGWGKQAATAERPVTDKTWDYALYCTFESLAEHDAYQVDPQHDVFIDEHKHRWAKVLVMDAE